MIKDWCTSFLIIISNNSTCTALTLENKSLPRYVIVEMLHPADSEFIRLIWILRSNHKQFLMIIWKLWCFFLKSYSNDTVSIHEGRLAMTELKDIYQMIKCEDTPHVSRAMSESSDINKWMGKVAKFFRNSSHDRANTISLRVFPINREMCL